MALSKIKGKNPFPVVYAALIGIGLIYLARGFYQMLDSPNIPVDLALRWWHMKSLLSEGANIYATDKDALYPPSMFVLLWPLIGWLSYDWVSPVWSAINAISVAALMVLTFKWLKWRKVPHDIRWLITLAIPAFHSISHALGIGQVTVVYITLFFLVVYRCLQRQLPLWEKLVWMIPLALSMGKYSLFIPLIVPLLLHKKLRTVTIGAIVLNLILSWLVAFSIDTGIFKLMALIIENSNKVHQAGSLDLQALLSFSGLSNYGTTVGSLILLAVFVVINFRIRSSNLLIQLALAAITARFWVYHGHYDNLVLIFVPMALALFITSSLHEGLQSLTASPLPPFLIGLTILTLIIPSLFLVFKEPMHGLFLLLQLVVWLYSGGYLLYNTIKKPGQPQTSQPG